MLDILDFPDEILCKIFEYLSPFDALYSFLNLNNRFNRLLIPFKYQIDLTYLSYEQFMYYINIILPIINQDEKLYVIKLGNKRTPGQIKLFNQLICNENYRDYFNKIDKILLESPRLDELIDFVNKYVLSLTNLLTFSIKIDNIRDEYFQELTKLIVNSIFSISTLVKLSIEMPSGLNLSRLSNTIMFYSLIHITLNLTLVTDLLILIQYIPNVENLSISIGWWASGDRTLRKTLDEMRLNKGRTIFLNNLKKFHLIINSILTFQFDDFEQVLFRILNNQTTYCFSFILQNSFIRNDELIKLIDGQQWEYLLSIYIRLIQFNLFIRMKEDCLTIDEEIIKINSFKTKYFREKKWFFSYFKYSSKDKTIFYSIPYKNTELFDILIHNDKIFNNFSTNYTSILSIDQTDNKEYQLNQIRDFILKYFPSLQQLHLNHFNTNSSIINPLNIPSLHTLKIEKERNINLSNIIQLLPLINTLFISYFTINDRSKSLKYVRKINIYFFFQKFLLF
jgi:hypothetical protein